MAEQLPEILAARTLAEGAAPVLRQSAAFLELPETAQRAILGDLDRIRAALSTKPKDPYALSLDTPADLTARRRWGVDGGPAPDGQAQAPAAPAAPPAPDTSTAGPRQAATETLAARMGALSDEINFPAFVAGLVHGTFDAIVDATIRQMEAFAELVSAVAKDVDEFTRENVTPNQVRDHLVHQYPAELQLELPTGSQAEPRVRVRAPADSSQDGEFSPAWLAGFGLAGETLTDDMVEEKLIPAARRTVGESRLKMLASMVLLGMSRVSVKDGSVSARVRFRAAAKDRAFVNYAVNQDAGGGPANWAQGRGSAAYDQHSTLVSTVGVNVQADSALNAELFGEVKINFVSETLPLERFADAAALQLLQRNARTGTNPVPSPAPAAAPAAPAATPATPSTPAPATGPAPATTPAAPASATPAPAPAATPRSTP